MDQEFADSKIATALKEKGLGRVCRDCIDKASPRYREAATERNADAAAHPICDVCHESIKQGKGVWEIHADEQDKIERSTTVLG